jgi:hypothetical protein
VCRLAPGESHPGTRSIQVDTVLTHFAVLLEGIFFLGLTGSALVILLTSIEDIKVLLEKDEPSQAEGAQKHG